MLVLDALKDILRTRDGERYAGEGVSPQFKGSDPPGCLSNARYFRLLPIYVLPDEAKIITRAMSWLNSQAEYEIEFVYYDLVYLFQQLVLTSPLDGPSKMSMGAAEAHLTR